MTHKISLLILLLLITTLFPALYCYGENNALIVAGYNVNSGKADSDIVSKRISELQSNLMGLSEVANETCAANIEKIY